MVPAIQSAANDRIRRAASLARGTGRFILSLDRPVAETGIVLVSTPEDAGYCNLLQAHCENLKCVDLTRIFHSSTRDETTEM
jgi:hypothetical protein